MEVVEIFRDGRGIIVYFVISNCLVFNGICIIIKDIIEKCVIIRLYFIMKIYLYCLFDYLNKFLFDF